MPKFTHDCDKCRFLGTGTVDIFGGTSPSMYDFYVCGDGIETQRTFIARYGNKREDYTSGKLFECTYLTNLDKVALFNALELTAVEEKALLRNLIAILKDGLKVTDYRRYNIPEIFLGKGNVVFGDKHEIQIS